MLRPGDAGPRSRWPLAIRGRGRGGVGAGRWVGLVAHFTDTHYLSFQPNLGAFRM